MKAILNKITSVLPRILLIMGLLGFASAIVNLIVGNYNSGVALLFGLSFFLFLYGLRFGKLIKIKWLTFLFFAVCIYFLVMTIFIAGSGRNDNVTYSEDAVIVLGAGIRGEEVGRLLSYRLDKAIEYSARNPEAVIVVSGGQGPQESIPEALAMERYLIAKGIPAEKIIKEDKSESTFENLTFSREILDRLLGPGYEVVIITNDFHIYRASRLAVNAGLSASHYHARTTWYSLPVIYLRESVAIMKFWILGE